jgi:hypothetical protein
MAGRRGPGSEEAPVAQPTNVPTPAELAPHQPCRARSPATSTSSMLPTPPCHTAAGPRDTGSGLRCRRLSWPSKGIWPPSPQHAGAQASHRPDPVAAHAGAASPHSPYGIQPRPASSPAKAAIPCWSQSKGGTRQVERARAPCGHAWPPSTPATRADPAAGPRSKHRHAARHCSPGWERREEGE